MLVFLFILIKIQAHFGPVLIKIQWNNVFILNVSKMAAQRRYIARERNEIGLTNFVDSLRSLFLQIQHLNAREIESEYLETTRSHLESATVLLL